MRQENSFPKDGFIVEVFLLSLSNQLVGLFLVLEQIRSEHGDLADLLSSQRRGVLNSRAQFFQFFCMVTGHTMLILVFGDLPNLREKLSQVILFASTNGGFTYCSLHLLR